MKRSGRTRATTEKVNQRISKRADSDLITTTGDIQNVLKLHKTSELVKRQFDEE